jgi:polysaccharide biosynthesis/export protein
MGSTTMARSSMQCKANWKTLGCCVLSLVLTCAAHGQTDPSQVQAQNAPAPTQGEAPKIAIGAGDLLNVDVFDTPELSGSVRVNQNGEGNLPVLGIIELAGLNSNQAARKIEAELKARGLLIDPHVTVSIAEYATQGATLMGEVHSPGLYPTLGSRKLLDMIALAGGVTTSAGRLATIIHRGDPQHPVNIPLAPNANSLAAQENPVILPGDTVVIARAGIIYILGAVGKPGGFLVDNNERLSLMQAITLAGGWSSTAAMSQVRLIRKVPEGREEIKLNLKQVVYGKEADVKVSDGDILFVPSSLGKTLAYRGLEAAIVAAQNSLVFVALN